MHKETSKVDLIKSMQNKVDNKILKLFQALTRDGRNSFFNSMTEFRYIFAMSGPHLKGKQSYIPEGTIINKFKKQKEQCSIKLIFREKRHVANLVL